MPTIRSELALVVIALASGFFLCWVSPSSAEAQQLWFSPGDDLEVGGIIAHPDYPQLFSNDSWPKSSASVNVLQSRAPYLLRMPDVVIQTMLGFLKSHHIELAIPLPMLPSDICGQGIEGILPPRQIAAYAGGLNAKLVDLKYLVMDEPLYYGHDYSGKNACHMTVSEVAEGVARSVQVFRSFFPDLKFILVEPEQSLPGGTEELSQFLDAYSTVLHEPPISVRFDVQWRRNWQSEIPPFIKLLQQRGIGFGVIFNAGGRQTTDSRWIASAKQNTTAWEKYIKEKPEHVMIQSWNLNPVRVVPESDPTTMTGFLKWYIEQRSPKKQ